MTDPERKKVLCHEDRCPHALSQDVRQYRERVDIETGPGKGVAEDKDPLDAQMLLNHKAAIEFLVDQGDDLQINASTILNLHALLSDNLLGDPSACGRLRTIPVGISKTVYHPLAIPQLIHECFNKILATSQAIVDPFEQSFR